MSTDLARASAVIEALSAAWTVYNLYPDPVSQPAFGRVADTLREAVGDEEVSLEIGPNGFLVGDEEVEVSREAADRFVKQCFLHHLEVLAVSGRPSDRDIVKFLGVIGGEEEEYTEKGGVVAALVKEGVSCFTVVARSMLSAAEGEETIERDSSVREALSGAADPEQFAAALLAEAGGDHATLGGLFHDRYRDILAKVEADDITGREEVVRAFVDTFFYFEEPGQVAVLERFLGGQEDWLDRVFLDQFAGNELAILAPQLDSRGFSLLLDYARIATDQTDKRPAELLGLLESPEPVRSARELVAARVQERLADLEPTGSQREAFASLHSQVPDSKRYFYETLDTFRGLLSVEERDDRFRRLMRVLTGKISGSIRRGRFRRAELWMRAALDHPTYDANRAEEVEEAIHQAGSVDVLEVLVGEVAAADEPGPARRLLTTLGTSHVDQLIDMMANEEERARRKILLDVLGAEATRDPSAVIARLDDERWFVVRNLALVLGRARHPGSVAALAGLSEHSDHRVRVEALRALSVIQPDNLAPFSKALEDSHESVRQAAIALLGTRATGEADSLLIQALWSATVETTEKERVIRVLGDRPGRDARDALESIAKKRFTLSAKVRQLRAAARDALGSTS